jgi:phage terminase large subunit-like protein
MNYANEKLRRLRSRESLIDFSQAIDIPGVPAGAYIEDATYPLDHPDVRLRGKLVDPTEREQWQFKPITEQLAIHHVLIMALLQRTMLKSRGRCMIFAPPGSAKSTYAAVLAPSWYLGKFPGSQIILASYATGIATKQSRRVRSICRDPMFSSIWAERPILAEDQRAIDDWSLSTGSSLMAAGLLAGITGNRADGLIIDDPVANREQAESPTIREKIYNEFVDTALTRAKPRMWVVLIQTRWQEDDLAGSILPADYNGESGMIKCRDGQTWEVLCIPAEAERADDPLGRQPGQFLWPEWFPPEHWLTWRDNPRARRTWAALYQQRPSPATGVHFTREMFEKYRFHLGRPPGEKEARPKHLQHYGASDFATMDPQLGKDPDYTEHGMWGIDASSELWALDWFYEQCETDKGIAAMMAKILQWKPLGWGHEGGIIDKAIGPFIRNSMRSTRAWTNLIVMPSIQDKPSKLQAFHGMCEAGMIHIPYGAWGDRLIDLLVKFPGGKHDDGPDVCGLVGRMVDQMMLPTVPVDKQREIIVPFTEKWLEWGSKPNRSVRYTS